MEDALSQRQPRPGVEQWRNPRNDLVVVRLHYTADPGKRSAEWKANTSRNMHPRAWKREYEIDWSSPAGEPVIPEFQEGKHVQPFLWDRGLRLLRGWDFGFVSPVCLFAQLTPWGQLRFRRELCPFNTPLGQLWEAVQAVTLELGGEDEVLGGATAYDVAGVEVATGETPGKKETFDAGDPAATNQTDLGAQADFLGARGVVLHTNRPGTEVSYANLRSRFLRDVMEPGVGPVPAVLVHPECRNLRSALAGAFCLSPLPPHRPVKTHPEKDLVDAARYLEDNLAQLAKGWERDLKKMALEDVRELRAGPQPAQREFTAGGEFFRAY